MIPSRDAVSWTVLLSFQTESATFQSILPGRGDLAEHVFVKIALGVAVVHGDLVDHVDNFGEQGRRGDGEASALHVPGVGGAVTAEGAQPGEDVVAYHGIHLARIEVLEARPAEILVGALLAVFAFGKEAPGDGFLVAIGFQLLGSFEFVEALEKEQVGDLLNDFHGIGDAAGPEGVPDAVDLIADFTCKHECADFTFGQSNLGEGN